MLNDGYFNLYLFTTYIMSLRLDFHNFAKLNKKK